MRRLISFAIVFAAAMALGTGAKAASLYFELASTVSSASCAAPCFQVRMFIEDPGRALQVQAIQMDVDVTGAATVARLPAPPECNASNPCPNPNVSRSGETNATYDFADETSSVLPWNLSATVGASPNAGFDALLVLASDTPFTVASLDAARTTAVVCTGTVSCPIQAAALPLNRVYLGRFNITAPTGPVAFGVRVGGIMGNGLGNLPLLNGGSCSLSFFGSCSIPEPFSVLLLGAALMGLSLVRRRAYKRNG